MTTRTRTTTTKQNNLKTIFNNPNLPLTKDFTQILGQKVWLNKILVTKILIQKIKACKKLSKNMSVIAGIFLI